VITVVGEALVDLVIDPAGGVVASLGGAPFNTARACGRLGVDVAFVGALSTDRFGAQLRARLVDDGVDVADAPAVDVPTTLAAAELDDGGSATYRFYVDGTSAPQLVAIEPAVAGRRPDIVVTGGLALVLEPMADSVEAMLGTLPESTMVVVDVNCRPLVIGDRASYRSRVARALRCADVVKVSDEDLDYLEPGTDSVEAARRLLGPNRGLDRGLDRGPDRGPDRPGVVLVTGGPAGVRIVSTDGDVTVPVDPVAVVDTIGAGDTFSAAFVSWWSLHGFGRAETADPVSIERAVRAATTAAGIACTRRGADPPYRHELPVDWTH
jgi:fructokinase